MPLNRIITIILANKNSFKNEFRKKETVSIQSGMQKFVSYDLGIYFGSICIFRL